MALGSMTAARDGEMYKECVQFGNWSEWNHLDRTAAAEEPETLRRTECTESREKRYS